MNKFNVKLGTAYYHQGFFNVGIKNSIFLSPKHRDNILIQLGNSPKIIQGYINRSANPNGTARIMCGVEYTQWIQKHFNPNDQFKVEILSPKSIRISTL